MQNRARYPRRKSDLIGPAIPIGWRMPCSTDELLAPPRAFPQSLAPPLLKIAAELGLSESRLRHLFAEAMGISPHRWSLRQRLDAARDLLGVAGLSVKEVAYLAGFCTPAHFTYIFRRHIGVTPRQYHRTVTAQQESDSPQQDHDINCDCIRPLIPIIKDRAALKNWPCRSKEV